MFGGSTQLIEYCPQNPCLEGHFFPFETLLPGHQFKCTVRHHHWKKKTLSGLFSFDKKSSNFRERLDSKWFYAHCLAPHQILKYD